MQETKETVHLAVLDDGQVLYLEKVEGPHDLRMPSLVGRICGQEHMIVEIAMALAEKQKKRA